MKITINFKTPDVLDYALDGIDEFQSKGIRADIIKKYVGYGEELTVEYDTETATMVVVPR